MCGVAKHSLEELSKDDLIPVRDEDSNKQETKVVVPEKPKIDVPDSLLGAVEISTCIKFCVKNEIKCADAFRMLTVAYGEATLDRSNVYRWYKMFSEGREDVNELQPKTASHEHC
ncbi:hypothetical protein LAZ67_8001078 [Cordylochernes scorpioides]|uniref:Mos1 transposase HTH domain-containing protein n=1 Tax=Cordylochernes scorpioides TaxID=51811 RepID=A0ABY6KTI9_9ARAC|nr:hypothetical protein LAZ67_8001078 [Cordylochernes scorpioides]